MINKKGEKIYFVWWVFITFFVAVVIVTVTTSYFTAPIDVRESHSRILYNSLFDCLVDNGELRSEVLKDDFSFSACAINSDLMMQRENFYYNVTITEFSDMSKESTKKVLKNFTAGVGRYVQDCAIADSIKAPHYVSCYEKEYPVYLHESSGVVKKVSIKILAASANTGARIPISGRSLNE